LADIVAVFCLSSLASSISQIWEWALIQCVSNGLSLQRMGLYDSASVQLAMADAWAASGDFVGP
jgi:hypothetical protein